MILLNVTVLRTSTDINIYTTGIYYNGHTIAVLHQQRQFGSSSVIAYNGSLVIPTSPRVDNTSSVLLMTCMRPRLVVTIVYASIVCIMNVFSMEKSSYGYKLYQ